MGQYFSGFRVEKHDDLEDAFSLLVNSTLDHHANESTWIMAFLGGGGDDDTLYYRGYVDVG
jgi:hypothetical protein